MRKQLMKSGRAFVLIAMVMSAEWAKAEGDTESFNQFGSQFGGTSGLTPQGPQDVGTFQAAFEVRTNTNGDPRGKQVKQDCAVCHRLSVLINGKEYKDGEAATLRKGETHTVKVKDRPEPRSVPPGGDSSPPHISNQKFTVWPKAVDGQTITSIAGTGPADSPQVFIAKKAQILQYLLDNSEGLMAQDKDWPENPADEPMNKTALLLPVQIKVSSADSPSTSAPKYAEAPEEGNADNLFSVWLGEDFTVKVKLPESFQLPPNLIKWNVPGENIPDNTKEYTFNWTAVGTKRIEVQVGESTFEIWVDVPHVGDVGQLQAIVTMPPWATAQIGSWGTFAQNYCNTHYPESPKRDAIRHSYWCALSVSDGYVTQDQVLYFTTTHEHDDKWTDNEQSFNTTMDLWNNFTGSTVDIAVPSLPPTPNTSLILQALEQKYSAGELWIFDGNTSQGASEGIILKSDGSKIHSIN